MAKGSSGFDKGGNGNMYKKLEIPQDVYSGTKFDANRLQGTEKQIRYAQDIIDNGYSAANYEIEIAIEGLKYNYEKFGTNEYEKLVYSAARTRAAVETKKILIEALGRTKTAAGVIKNKYMIQRAMPETVNNLTEKYRKEYLEKYKKKFKN